VPVLFQNDFLSNYLARLLAEGQAFVEEVPEEDFLQRSDDDLVSEAVALASSAKLTIHTAEAVAGDVEEIRHQERHIISGQIVAILRNYLWAEYEWEGNGDLFWYGPTQRLMVQLEANISPGRLRIGHVVPGPVDDEIPLEQAKAPLDQQIGRIANMVDNANNDVTAHNAHVEARLRPLVVARRGRILNRRDLKGKLGFQVERRRDAPRPVPLQRKVLGVQRRRGARPADQRSYEDEYELDLGDYEDVIAVLSGMLRAFERTPSVLSGRDEELLRDSLLVQLNGTFEGAATGETFVRSGKTDILVRQEDRHVFVGECKWYDGPQSVSRALGQLLGYLPWRDEKAALLMFIDRNNATAAMDSAEAAVREHASFKREGPPSNDPSHRRNFVLGHPEDPDREIRLALLFAVLPPGRE
jgi:hypothetical protein